MKTELSIKYEKTILLNHNQVLNNNKILQRTLNSKKHNKRTGIRYKTQFLMLKMYIVIHIKKKEIKFNK